MYAHQQQNNHGRFRVKCRRFLREHVAADAQQMRLHGPSRFRSLCRLIGREGFFAMAFPRSVGGAGLDLHYRAVFYDEVMRLGELGFALAISTQADIATRALARHGSAALLQRYLQPALAGEALGALAFTGARAHSSLAHPCTTARRSGDFWHVEGRKVYITNGALADFVVALVDVVPEGGPTLLVIPTSASGVQRSTYERKRAVAGANHAAITFDGVRVPHGNVIGRVGAGSAIAQESLELERVILTIIGARHLRNCIEGCRRWTSNRRVDDEPLSAKQTVAWMLLRHEVDCAALEALGREALAALANGQPAAELAAMAKLKMGTLAIRVASDCLHLLGGAGLLGDEKKTDSIQDARCLAIAGGTNEAMLSLLYGLRHKGVESCSRTKTNSPS